MLAKDIFERYLTVLLETPEIWNKFTCAPIWKHEVARALANVGLLINPNDQSREVRDADVRSDQVALDVCITDHNAWGPPVFVAEHETAPRRADIQNAAWKLLAIRTQRRVLVAYHHPKSDVRDHKAIEAAVREVCLANPGKSAPNDIVLITAPFGARPSSAQGLRELHEHSIVGVMA